MQFVISSFTLIWLKILSHSASSYTPLAMKLHGRYSNSWKDSFKLNNKIKTMLVACASLFFLDIFMLHKFIPTDAIVWNSILRNSYGYRQRKHTDWNTKLVFFSHRKIRKRKSISLTIRFVEHRNDCKISSSLPEHRFVHIVYMVQLWRCSPHIRVLCCIHKMCI